MVKYVEDPLFALVVRFLFSHCIYFQISFQPYRYDDNNNNNDDYEKNDNDEKNNDNNDDNNNNNNNVLWEQIDKL